MLWIDRYYPSAALLYRLAKRQKAKAVTLVTRRENGSKPLYVVHVKGLTYSEEKNLLKTLKGETTNG